MFSNLLVGLPRDSAMFLVAAVVTIAVVWIFLKNVLHHNKFAVRVKALQERRAQLRADLITPRKRTRNQAPVGMDLMRMVVNKLNLIQKSQVGKINRMMINAGYRTKDAIFIFAFFQLVLPVFFLVVAIVASKIEFAHPFATKWKPLFILGMAFLGLKLPSIIVMNARNKRYYEIQKSLSDTLDLMMICAEAGLSLAAALDRVSRELVLAYPEMAEELMLTSIEIGFLPDRKRALQNLAERVDMPEIRGIVGVLIQTEKYGTPIAQALRVLASEFRTARMLRAEQKAARLPAIMTVPMIIFILPTLFIVVLSPALIRVSHNM
jgi:tight adherence protein C